MRLPCTLLSFVLAGWLLSAALTPASASSNSTRQQEMTSLLARRAQLIAELGAEQARYQAEARWASQQAGRGLPTQEGPSGSYIVVPDPTPPNPQLERELSEVEGQLQMLGSDLSSLPSRSTIRPGPNSFLAGMAELDAIWRRWNEPYHFTVAEDRLRKLVAFGSTQCGLPWTAPDSAGLLTPECIANALWADINSQLLRPGDLRLLLGACDRDDLAQVQGVFRHSCSRSDSVDALRAITNYAGADSLAELRIEAHQIFEEGVMTIQARGIKLAIQRKKAIADSLRCNTFPGASEYIAVDQLPSLISKASPVYPNQARAAGTSGTILIQALINCSGEVIRADAASGPTELRTAAIDAVRQYQFTPALQKGQTVPCWVTVAIPFTHP